MRWLNYCRILKLTSVALKSRKSVIAICFYSIPLASAVSLPTSDPITTQIRAPIFKIKTPADYVLPCLMVFYLTLVSFLRLKTTFHTEAFRVAFSTAISTGLLSYVVNRDEFADAIRTT
jgi:hypothetical protein